MKSQIITREIIERELLLKQPKYEKIQFKIAIPRIVIALVLLTLYAVFVTASNLHNPLLAYAILSIGLFLASLCFTKIFIDYYGLKKAAKNKKYFITTDCLIYKEQFKSNHITEDAVFDFQKYKRTFDLGSEFFNTCDNGVYDAAEVYDKFYLVVYKKQILCIYNTRFYALDEELQKELRT